jgi:hypothetical protein
MKKLGKKAQEKLVQEVDHRYNVGTEESKPSIVKDLAQIQMRGGEETTTKIIAEEEEERMRTNQPMTSPIVPTTAPNEPTTACGTINGAYISYSVQHNNILRSHQIVFSATEVDPPYVPEEEGDWMRQEKHMSMMSTTATTMTASGTINGVYISSPVQYNNILRSLQIIFTATDDKHLCNNDEDNVPHDHDLAGLYEALKSLTNSPVFLNCLEQMINPGSRFTFVARQLSKYSGEPFRHFLHLFIAEEDKIAEAYRCIS